MPLGMGLEQRVEWWRGPRWPGRGSPPRGVEGGICIEHRGSTGVGEGMEGIVVVQGSEAGRVKYPLYVII